MKMAIAIVSDLHVGDGARSRDLDPNDDGSGIRDEKYIEQFAKFCQTQGIKANALVIPGDITNHATPDEFQLASEKLNAIALALEVPTDRILFVPGNHDVDWDVMKIPDKSGTRRKQRYQPLVQANCLFHHRLSESKTGNITEEPYFCLWQYDDLLVLGQNSASHDAPDSKPHHGLVPQASINAIDLELAAHPQKRDQLRLAIVHHHPLQYSDPVPNEPDFSAMTNSEALLKVLAKHGFDLLIHGHKHKPNFNCHMVNSYHSLPILGAGSFSYRLDPRWSGLVNNQFHRIEIHGRDDDTSRILGEVQSYSYLCGHGWLKSASANGIEHSIFFGGYTTEIALRKRLISIIHDAFESSDFLDWDAESEGNSDLKYVPSAQLLRTLEHLEEDLGFRLYRTPDRIILLRKQRGA
jgi:predicted phosphodiesterase